MTCFFASIDYNTIFVAQNELKTSCDVVRPHFNQKLSPKAQFLQSGTPPPRQPELSPTANVLTLFFHYIIAPQAFD